MSGLAGSYRSLGVIKFRWLVVAHFISFAGTVIQGSALEWWVKQSTTDPYALAALLCSILSGITVAALIGTFVADHFDRRKLLIWLQVAGVLQAIALLVVFQYGFNLWFVLALSFSAWLIVGFDGCIRIPFNIAVVGDKDAGGANSVMLQAAQIAALIGYYASSRLITFSQPYGEGICFALNAASFLPQIAVLALMGRRENRNAGKVEAAPLPTVSLFRECWSLTAFRQIMLQTGVICLFSMYNPAFLAVFAENVHGGNAKTFANLWMVRTIGKFVGCAMAGAVTARRNQLAGWALVGQAPALILFALAPNLPLAMIFLFAFSLLDHLQLTLNAVEMALLTEPANRGRVTSVRVVFGCGLEFISVYAAGQLADAYGVQATTAGYGFLGLAASLLLIGYFRSKNQVHSTFINAEVVRT